MSVAPLVLLIAAAYVAAVTIQILPLRSLAPLKLHIHYATAPHLEQSWAFFAPYLPRESRVANLYMRVEHNGETREAGPFPIRRTIGRTGPLAGYCQSRAACLTSLFELSLWNPRGPALPLYQRVLSGAAAGIDRRGDPGRVVAVRGTVTARRIAAPGERADASESLVLNTGWLPYLADVAAR